MSMWPSMEEARQSCGLYHLRVQVKIKRRKSLTWTFLASDIQEDELLGHCRVFLDELAKLMLLLLQQLASIGLDHLPACRL